MFSAKSQNFADVFIGGGGGNNFATPFFLARVRRITVKLCKFTNVKELFLAASKRILDK